MNYSNSLLNAYRAYLKDQECGLLLKARYIDKTIEFVTSDVQQAGLWFEFMATGEKLRDGGEPEPVKTKSGALAAISKHLTGQLENFKEVYKDITIVDTGHEVVYDKDGRTFKGIYDVLAENGVLGTHIRDIKASGLINDKRMEGGWVALEGDGPWIPVKKHIHQAKMYIWLWFNVTGEIAAFVFDVFSNVNPTEFKTIEIHMDEDTLNYYEKELLELCDSLDQELEEGLLPKAHYKRCGDCPLSEECEFRMNLPPIESYYL